MTARVFKRYTLDEYIAQVLKPAIDSGVVFTQVHVHGTDKPNIAMWRKHPGEYYMQVMYRAHLMRGFLDIAQHGTLDPDGYIWDGRPLDIAPASATGHNESSPDRHHPFMFEMIGQFDTGNEKLEGPQLATAAGLTHAVMKLMNRGTDMIHLHREFTPLKTCPGTSISRVGFIRHVMMHMEVEPDMKKEDAEKVVKALQELWKLDVRNIGGVPIDRDEIHRITNEVRKAGGLPLE